jgi:excinuclease ABC subunit B
MAVVDDPTAKVVRLPAKGKDTSRPHKPHLDEMGIATYHEVKPARPAATAEARSAKAGPRSTTGKPGMRGGWKPRGR